MAVLGFLLMIAGFIIAIVWCTINSENKKERKEPPRPAPFILAICICFAAGLGLVFTSINKINDETKSLLADSGADTGEKDAYGHKKSYAIVTAENVVKSNLKSPSTADFCSSYEYTVTRTKNTWTVKGYVDAQNSLGAVLRNNFTVKITFTGTDGYTVDSCIIS